MKLKKKYVKPTVIFESFELSKSIATGCEQISNSSQGVCPVLDPDIGKTYITDGACQMTPPGGYDSICYHAPTENSNVFSS